MVVDGSNFERNQRRTALVGDLTGRWSASGKIERRKKLADNPKRGHLKEAVVISAA